MATLFAVTLFVTLTLLVAVWLGPRLLIWLMRWYMNRITKKVRAFEARRQQRHAEISVALDGLQRHMQQRKADQ